MAVRGSQFTGGNEGSDGGGTTTRERISYLRGLLHGCDFTAAGAGHKQLWDGLLDVVDGLVQDADALRSSMEEQDEYIDAMDEALWSVEERIETDDDDVVVELDDENIAVECPNCGQAFVLEPANITAAGETRCPECGKAVTLQSVNDDGDLRAVYSQTAFPPGFQDDHLGNGSPHPPPQPS